jgi:predicted permease
MLRGLAMSSALIVLETVLAVVAVIGVGAVLRRRGVLTEASAASMGRLVADVAFPALCLDTLARGDAGTLCAGAVVAIMGFATLAIAAVVGLAIVRVLGVSDRSRPTAVFAIAIGNWIFLPLPVADALYGAAGTTTVILNNVGAQLFLWTLGIVILRRGELDGAAGRAIATSPGLWATIVGIAIALAAPPVPAVAAPLLAVVGGAVHLLASLTIPLVCVAIGAQLAAPSARADARSVAAIVVGRMFVAPILVSVAIELAQRTGATSLGAEPRMTEHLIAAMPVSLSAAALVERYAGDTALVSRAILVTTLMAIVTAPLWTFALTAWT